MTLKEQLNALGLMESDIVFHHVATKRRDGWEKQYIYRVKEGDDAIIVRRFLNNESEVMLIKDHFKTQKEYGFICVEQAERLRLPVEVVLAVGHKNADIVPKELYVDDLRKIKHELLDTGIQRRKMQIYNLIGKDLYAKFDVEKMGQLNSKRLATYLSSIIK